MTTRQDAMEGIEALDETLRGARVPAPSFWAALLFAALAAGLLPAFVLVLGASFGQRPALALYLVATTTAYAIWLAPSRRAALAGGLFAGLAGSLLLLVLPLGQRQGLFELALGCALIASAVRSVLHYRASALRGLLLELLLLLAGLGLAKLLFTPSLAGTAAALWGYLLLQSLFCLAPGLRLRHAARERGDGFQRASARLRTLLEEA